MSIKLMTQVWDLELRHVEKLVLLSLADQANDTGLCWPSIATIAYRCGLSERGLRNVLDALAEAGQIRREQRAGRSTHYHVTPAPRAPHPGTACTPTPAPRAPHPGTTCTPPRHDVHSTPARGAGDPGTACTHNPQEPKENPKGNEEGRPPSVSGSTIGMPTGVNPEALTRWEQWLRFKGKPVNDLSRPAIARRLVSFGDAERQGVAVEHSIAGQYLQLYPPKPELVHSSNSLAQPRVRAKTVAELEVEAASA